MSEWCESTLEEIASPGRYSVVGGPFGSALGRKDYVAEGVPVIRGAQLNGTGRFSHDDLVYVSEAKASGHVGNLAYPGDVLVTQRGTVGQVGLIPDDAPFERYLLSQSQMKLTVDPSRAERRFVYYWLCSPEAQHAIHGSTISAGVPHINLATFKALKIGLPPLDAQGCIAGILGSLDDLIANNRRRVEVLEEMARAIYREWFVHFRYPGHENSTFVGSADGQVPEGWAVKRIAELSAAVTRGIAPKYATDGAWVVLNQKCVRNERVSLGPARWQERQVPEAKQARRGDVLINSTGVGTLGRVALYRGESDHVTVDSHVTIARPANALLNPWYGLTLVSRKLSLSDLPQEAQVRQNSVAGTLVRSLPSFRLSIF